MHQLSPKAAILSVLQKKQSVKARKRAFLNEFSSQLSLLEKRVLLADITISSPSDLAQYFNSANNTYTIDAGKDTVTINSGISLSTANGTGVAGDIIITGDTLKIGANVSMITDAGGNNPSGNIEITGKNIEIGNNVLISANGTTDTLDGSISISAENEPLLTFGLNAWMQIEDIIQLASKDQSATIGVGAGSQIVGGTVTVQAASGNPLKWENYTAIVGSLVGIISALNGHPNPLSLPVAFQSWSPKSEITLGTDTQISASATVKVNATAESNAIGKAAWMETFRSGFGFAVGLFFTDATANVTLSTGADLTATGSISVATTVTNSIELEVLSDQNRGISPTNPDAVNLSYGLGSLKTNSVIDVQAGSSVISESGSVTLAAAATDTNKVKVKGKTYRDGLATISVGTLLTDANVQVIVNGTVSSGLPLQDVTEPEPLIFNPATTVDFAKSQLTFPDPVPYTTGQELVFDSADGATIPGLITGETYYAIVNPAQPNSLQLAATQEEALNGVNVQFGSAYPTLTIGNNQLPITLIDNAYSNSILFSYDKLSDGSAVLPNGDNTTVTYTPASGRFIGYNDADGNLIGALPAGTYTIKQVQWPADSIQSVLFPLAIQLIDSQGQTIVLNPNSYFTTSNGTNYQVASFDTESSLVDFNFEQASADNSSGLTPLPVPNQQVNLANGATLVYTSGLNPQVGNLANGQTYWAVVDPNQAGIIQLATSYAQSEAANPAVQDAVPQLQTIDYQACIDPNISDSLETANNQPTSSVLTLESNNSYQLYNEASSGTFQLTINGPEGVLTTDSLAYNISAADLQTTLNGLAGIEATVSGEGTKKNPWAISILFNFEIGNFQNGTELTFGNNPFLADGSGVIFLGVAGKPVPGLVSGQTYYAFNQANPDFISQFPQYIMTLKASNDASAADVNVDLSQTMTDLSGQSYTIGYKDAEAGLISLYLPEVTTPVAVDGSSLTGGTVSANQLTAPALVIYSVADSGTFTISLTDAGGTTQTTAPIAWNASASDVQSALNALSGIGAIVFGSGTYTSPWTITGIDPGVSVTDDTTNLLYQGRQTNLFTEVFYPNTQQVWVSGATGGTFTVTLNFGSNQLVTAELPYDITTQQFAQAINAMGFQASVYGTGTAADPWQFMAYYNPISTGKALTFHDAWNNPSLGMLDGQTYYAVTSGSQYNADEVMLSLATSATDAAASPPVLLNMQGYLQLQDNTSGVMTGSTMGLAATPTASGVTITTKLKSKDALTNMAKTGSYPPLKGFLKKVTGGDPYDVSGVGQNQSIVDDLNIIFDGDFGTLFFSDDEVKAMEKSLRDNKDRLDKFGYKDPKTFLESSLGLAVLIVNNNSQVIIGSQAQILSSGNVKLSSTFTEQFHAQADAGVSRTSHSHSASGNLAAALALAVSVLDNTSQVIVQPNAQINAGGKVSISSTMDYPFAWKATTISQLKNYGDLMTKDQKTWAGIGISSAILTQALTGSGAGMGNWLFNSSSNSYTIQADHHTHDLLGTALGGSINIVDVTNNNLAQICDGAQINQNVGFTDASAQGVSVTATTTMDQVSVAGQMKFFLNAAGLATLHPLDFNKSANVLGGSVNILAMDNSTQALIGGDAPENGNSTASPANGPTRINYGKYGMTANAATDIMYISLSQSGGSSTGFGLEASVAVTEVNSQNTTAAILSAANAPIIRNMANTAGNITITASDDTTLTPSSGGLLTGKSINIGFSSSEAVLNRNVSAFIGNADPTATVPATSWPVIQSAGNITISALATGKIVPASLAGSVINKGIDDVGQDVPGNPGSHFGFGVSGDYSQAKVADSVTAGINGGNLTGVSNLQAIDILATNETRLNLSTGAASLQFERGRDSAVGLAGSASYSEYTSNVWAGVRDANISAFEVGVLAQNNKTIGTFAAGLAGGSVAGVGIEVAGSVAINHVTNDTVAKVANTTGTDLGTLDVQAIETDDIWAAAGTVTFVTSFGSAAELDAGKMKTKVGFGFGFAQNLLDSTTHAVISDSELEQTDGELSLTAEQASRSFVLSAGAVFEVGKGTGITPYGMVAVNQYTNADVQAVVQNSQITSSSSDSSAGMLIASQLIPIMITAAGDLGLSIAYKTGAGAEASIGAGVSVTEVSITGNSVASVSNSNVTLDQGDLEVKAYTGQAANATNLNNTLTNLNLPPGNYNLYSLAIAGGLTTAIAPFGELAVGIDGVGAGIGSSTSINTLANVSNSSEISLLGRGGSDGGLTVEALENLSVYDDAGGASVSIQTSSGISFGIAIGIGAGVHNSTNSVVASVTDSDVTSAESLSVSATSTSNVKVIGFGVALDVSVCDSAGAAGGISASSATGKITSCNTIAAYVTGGDITTGASLYLAATDDSQLQSVVGSGSLAVGGGVDGGGALAAGSSVSRIDPSHTISAYIGSMDANSTTQSNVTAGGSIDVQATNHQQILAQTIAVASS